MYIDAGTILNGQTEWDDIFFRKPMGTRGGGRG